ncbi:hypothetical protein ASD79_16050 [Caulobacter sp. Root655]|uniref:prepilin peptidase n=1 Tax=Caulobacter sp. Root655 TaxID=1736578 RepID=UPI0006FEA695|nr:A24 family peptidase [Caulobacter sp. Root655]KRA57825.1 hypothetical protein ASD79_16050 [Caulobacter sp. Root655]
MNEAWFLSAALPIGATIGSYASTVALRAGRGEQATLGRSRCDGCGRGLGFLQTIPVLSFLLRRGACETCAAPIARIHLIGEVLGGAAVALAFLVATPWRAGLLSVLGLALLSSALIDARTRRLPDLLTVLIAAAGATLAWTRAPTDLALGVVAAIAAFGLLQFVRLAFRALRGHDGMGFGDVKLIVALCLWLGPAMAWAIVIAGLVGLAAIAVIRPRDRRAPFGPAIALGAWSVGLLLEAGVWPA